ncbi:MAG: ribosomal protein S18-alanine N-acetyltransferase [Chloroflexi bacterium]|nr:ribosomal protein S18-alanine N-acetyltransferase [Chloroflexota bacterium]MBP8056535.1 ribosomal protein S18-alanine N-acetyltransferase [Chloroflexota bacterium]
MLKAPLPWQLRPMQLADIEPVLVIERASFPTAWSASGYEYELTGNAVAHYVVLTDEQGAIVGYAGYWLLADELHVSIIAVDPPSRGRGLGELLLLQLLFAAYDHAAVLATLEVRRSNEAAQALYRKYGFDLVGLRPRYYHDTNEDACIMTVSPLDEAYRHQLLDQWQTHQERLRLKTA